MKATTAPMLLVFGVVAWYGRAESDTTEAT